MKRYKVHIVKNKQYETIVALRKRHDVEYVSDIINQTATPYVIVAGTITLDELKKVDGVWNATEKRD